MSKAYAPRTINRADAILDGVVSISENEMLIHGEYITPDVVSEKLAKSGAICGGHQACLLGSVALAATGRYDDANLLVDWLRRAAYDLDDQYSQSWIERVTEARDKLNARPAVKLVMDALNDEATAILSTKRKTDRVRETLEDSANIAEGYFEVYLNGLSKPKTHEAIVALCKGARRRIAKQAR